MTAPPRSAEWMHRLSHASNKRCVRSVLGRYFLAMATTGYRIAAGIAKATTSATRINALAIRWDRPVQLRMRDLILLPTPDVAVSISGKGLITGGAEATAVALDLAAAINPLALSVAYVGISTEEPQPAAIVAVAANPFFVTGGRD